MQSVVLIVFLSSVIELQLLFIVENLQTCPMTAVRNKLGVLKSCLGGRFFLIAHFSSCTFEGLFLFHFPSFHHLLFNGYYVPVTQSQIISMNLAFDCFLC